MKFSRLRLSSLSYEILTKKSKSAEATEKPGWSLPKPVRAEITEQLLNSQKGICPYCQSKIFRGNYHIEHFKERADSKKDIYNYQNMMLSCEGFRFAKGGKPTEKELERLARVKSISCGHYKTFSFHQESIDYNLLLDPFKYDYADYMTFEMERVVPRKDIHGNSKRRAEYTINRLNLNSRRLIAERKIFLSTLMDILATYNSKSGINKYIGRILSNTGQTVTPYYDLLKTYTKLFIS